MADARPIDTVFKTEWFSIDAVPYGAEGERPYYRLSCDDSVSIIAQTENDKIILIRQYRPAIGDFTLEAPSGYIDGAESPEEAVKRELKEETGFICRSVELLGSLRICPSRINNRLHVFFGRDAKCTGNVATEDMNAELVLVTRDEFKKMILDGQYNEVAGIAMFYLAQARGYL